MSWICQSTTSGRGIWSAEVFASAKSPALERSEGNARLRLSARASAETDALQNKFNNALLCLN